jgi:uncharacterized protein YlxP (DUF503 family)
MFVGVIQLELSIPWAMSLKDKRQVVRSLKDRLRNTFNLAVAEVGENEAWRTAVIGMTTVGNDAKFIRSVCDKIVHWVEENCEATVEDYEVEVL